jgi:NADH-quinone oxidoreductase subunit J
MAALIFYICALAVITGALGVVLAHNPVHSALFLLLTLVSVAILFLQQDAALVAIIQIVVYASAIVVLFVFVIALLGVDQHETFEEPSLFQRPAAIALGALLFIQIVLLAGRHWATGEPSVRGRLSGPRSGNVHQLAVSLFTDYVWAFEITAVLLVIAVVGGVALARRSGQRPSSPSGAARTGVAAIPSSGAKPGAGSSS